MFQSELFKDLQTEQRPKHFQFQNFPGRFLRLRVAYEDAVFVLLGLMLVVLGGFCFGVERGKSLGPQPQPILATGLATARENVPVLVSARPEEGIARLSGQRKAIPVIPAAMPVAAPDPVPAAAASAEGEFVIQLATYVGQGAAQEEVRRLAKKGIQARVLKQGKYLELRALGYRSKAEAKAALAGLRVSYPDAFLKRVSTEPIN